MPRYPGTILRDPRKCWAPNGKSLPGSQHHLSPVLLSPVWKATPWVRIQIYSPVAPCSCQQSVCLVLCWQIIKQSPQSRPLPQGHPMDRDVELWSKGCQQSGWSPWAVSNTGLSWLLPLPNRSFLGLSSIPQWPKRRDSGHLSWLMAWIILSICSWCKFLSVLTLISPQLFLQWSTGPHSLFFPLSNVNAMCITSQELGTGISQANSIASRKPTHNVAIEPEHRFSWAGLFGYSICPERV